jgi:hypothetical protein
MGIASAKHRSPSRPRRREPDGALARDAGVHYRYVLRLQQLDDAAALLHVLSDVGIPLRYLVVVPAEAPGAHAAYVGLGCSDVADLPIRLASRGIRVELGEDWGSRAGSMHSRIGRCEAAATEATRKPRRGP